MPNHEQKHGGEAEAEAGSGHAVRMPRKSNPRQEYRLKQRALIEASPVIANKFPKLKALRVMLEYFDTAGTTKNGELKCKLNVEVARSALWFACPGVECTCGDFDLSEALAKAVAGRRKVATGELRCPGTRKHGEREPVTCGTLLRFRLNLNYD
jgi:hypothetical protein